MYVLPVAAAVASFTTHFLFIFFCGVFFFFLFARLSNAPLTLATAHSCSIRLFSFYSTLFSASFYSLDSDGNYTRINHSIPQRDSHFSVPLRAVIPWYQAYAKFVRLAHRDAFAFKTKPGDVLTFNNIRLLHGRTGYDDSEQNVRYIVGAYLDWDIIYSKLRVLKSAQAESLNGGSAL